MKILVDSSVWIDFFRRKNSKNKLPQLLVDDLVVTNPLILAEIIPSLRIRKQQNTIILLKEIESVSLTIDWDWVIETQVQYSKKFNHFVGIPDIVIVQNAVRNNCILYSFDSDILDLCELLTCEFVK